MVTAVTVSIELGATALEDVTEAEELELRLSLAKTDGDALLLAHDDEDIEAINESDITDDIVLTALTVSIELGETALEDVTEAEELELRLSLAKTDSDALLLAHDDEDTLELTEGNTLTELVESSVTLPNDDTLTEILLVELTPPLEEIVDVTHADSKLLTVTDGDPVIEDEVDPVEVIVAGDDDVGDTLTDELNDKDGDALRLVLSVTLPDVDTLIDTLPVGLTLALGDIVDVPHVDAELLTVTEGDPVIEVVPQGLDEVEPVEVIVSADDDVGDDEPDALTLTDELDDTDGDALRLVSVSVILPNDDIETLPVALTQPLEEIVAHADAELLIITDGDPVVEEELEIDTELEVVTQGLVDVVPIDVIIAEDDDVGDVELVALTLTEELDDKNGDADSDDKLDPVVESDPEAARDSIVLRDAELEDE